MMKRGLSIFLATLAVVTGSPTPPTPIPEPPAEKNRCFENKNCKKCLQQGPCAYYVAGETGPETGCYDYFQKDDEAFQSGTFFDGGDGKFNQLQCKDAKKAAKEPKTCEERNLCDRCLDDDKCAWKVQGERQKCVTANTCYPGYGEGQCYSGSTFPDVKKACRRMKRGKPPLKCKEYNGENNCYGCLTNGCYWSNEEQKCLKSCDDAPDGATCRGTYAPKEDGRKLLSFADEASATCYFLNIDYRDSKKCASADGDCSVCFETTLTPQWPDFGDDPLIVTKNCEYIPETGECVPDGGNNICPETDCSQRWPQLQGKNVGVAEEFLESLDENLDIILCNTGPEVFFPEPDLPYIKPPFEEEVIDGPKPSTRALSVDIRCGTKDLRCDRVRLFYDGSIGQFGGPVVSEIPQRG